MFLFGRQKGRHLVEGQLNNFLQQHDIQVKRHATAKHLILKQQTNGQLCLTVPNKPVSLGHIYQFLLKHSDWITSQQQQKPKTTFELPNAIYLIFTQQHFDASSIAPHPQNNIHAKQLLKQWLHAQAQQHLLPRLQYLSRLMQLSYNSSGIRFNKGRWGSCNSKKAINLNAGLLLLPIHCVDYVLIHELCHLVHLNHSAAFWHLVAQWCPNYKTIQQEIKQKQLPSWWYALL